MATLGDVQRRVELWRAAAFGDLWEDALWPWFKRCGPGAFHDVRPTVVITPSRAIGYELKRKWMSRCAGGIGVHFWTTGDLRKYLASAALPDRKVASRELLHLLLSQSATACGATGVASSVAFDPAALMRALDELAAAGWEWTELANDAETGAIVREFGRRLGESGFSTIQACDWALANGRWSGRPTPIRALLLHGFTGANWPLWPLLLASAHAADDVVVTLAYPRRQAERVDQIWIGSWEEHLGVCAKESEAEPVARPFWELAECLEAGRLATRRPIDGLAFEICDDAAAEARAIVGRTMAWMGGHREGHLAVVFQRAGVLSREVSRLLDAAGVPHDDALGSRSAHGADESAWRQWLTLQMEWTAGSLARFLAKRPDGLWAPAGDGRVLLDRLERMAGLTLDDDLDLLGAALASSDRPSDAAALSTLGDMRRIPESGAFDDLVATATDALVRLGWVARSAALHSRGAPLAGRVQGMVRRSQFLAWAEAAAETGGRERRPHGGEPHARAHLVSAGDAESQSWDAVILAGLNAGEWPQTVAASAFLPDARRCALNGRALIQGSQGEGHDTVVKGRGLILSEADQRYIGLRQSFNLIEGAGSSLCMTARIRGEDDPARLLGPADVLVRAHYVATDGMLTDERMAAMALQSTARWRIAQAAAAGDGHGRHPWRGAGPSEVRAAWDARRSETPFGPFDFCLRRPPKEPIRLACKAWEEAWRYPATTWLREVVGVAPGLASDATELGAQSLGTWAHGWLARALNPDGRDDFVPAPKLSDAMVAIDIAARASRSDAAEVFHRVGRELPALWDSVWKRAVWAARAMCEEALQEAGGFVRTECTLPAKCAVKLGGDALLHLRGRVDLVRAEEPGLLGRLSIIDFKTGGEIKLTPAELAKGKGLQVLLYGEALRELGAESVSIRIVRPGASGSARELSRKECLSLLSALAEMQNSGAFGVRGPMFSEYSYCPPLPMAVLAIAAELNDIRWQLTRGLVEGGKDG